MTRKLQDFGTSRRAAGRPRGRERLLQDAIELAGAGDGDALHYLYAVYADDLYSFILGVVLDHEVAEDVTQSFFESLPVTLAKGERGDAPFEVWLFGEARTAALDHLQWRRSSAGGSGG